MNIEQSAWPQRPWVLAVWLGVIGLSLYFVSDGYAQLAPDAKPPVDAAIAFLLVGGVSFAFILERQRLLWAIGFSFLWACVIGSLTWWSYGLRGYGSYVIAQIVSALFAAAIAIPIFQTLREQGRVKLPYSSLHGHAWGDVVSFFAAWVFVGIAYLLLFLLSALFQLVGINVIEELLKESWFNFTFYGVCFGAALGVLKEQHRIVSSIQSLVMTVLSILAPVLAIALATFLVALIFTGLQPLWGVTRSTTPIVLSCAAGAVLLINAVIRNDSVEQTNSRILKISAIVLALCLLPLALIAFVSTQQRISQYGITPDRLWAMVSVSIACTYGAAYLFSVVIKRIQWSDAIRTWNVRLALVFCVLLVVLAMPFLDFGKWSAHSQLERLQSGKVDADKFDVTAFAFDFGKTGRAILEELKQSSDSVLVERVELALTAKNRWELSSLSNEPELVSKKLASLTVLPEDREVPPGLALLISRHGTCQPNSCFLWWPKSSNVAHIMYGECNYYTSKGSSYKACPPEAQVFIKYDEQWKWSQSSYIAHADGVYLNDPTQDEVEAEKARTLKAIKEGGIEVRTVERKQLFIDGEPVGAAFEEPSK